MLTKIVVDRGEKGSMISLSSYEDSVEHILVFCLSTKQG